MSKIIGLVLDNENDGFARIVTKRSGACGGCGSSTEHCHSCLANSKIVSLVANPVDAKPGDTVSVELETGDVYKGGVILYLLPIFTLLAGALAGPFFGPPLGLSNTMGAISGALLGLVLGFAIVKLFDRSQWARRRLAPVITAVVSSRRRKPVSARPQEIHLRNGEMKRSGQ